MIKKISGVIKKNPVISSIILLALFLRLYGIHPGYPDIHPDESTSYHTAINLLYNFLNPMRFDYPAGMPFINALIYAAFFIPISIVRIIFTNFDALLQFGFNPIQFFTDYKEAIFGNRDFYAMYWSRAITAVFGAGTVLVLYLAGKKLFNKSVGLFAAFFLAVNYLHVLRSHFGLPDVYNGFFAVLTLFACGMLLEKDSRRNYLFAAISAGLMFSMKYQVFAFLPFFLTHLFLTFRKRSFFNLFNKDFILSLFTAALVFLVINPYYIFNIDEAMRQNRLDVLRYRMGDILLRPFGYFYLYHWGIGKLPSIMVILGIIMMLLKSPLRFVIVGSFAFAFLFFMTVYSQGGIFTRNFANVIPYLMLFAGYGMYILFTLLMKTSRSAAKVIIFVFLLLVNFTSFQNSFTLGKYYSEPWNIIKLGEWFRDELPNDATIRHYQLFVRQVGGKALEEKRAVLRDWDYSKGPNSLAEFQEEGDQFAVLNTEPLQNITYWWRGWSDPKLFLRYKTVPFDFIQNDFYGLTVKELLQYTVFEAYKPWQAHNAHNYIVFKIPQKPTVLGNKIADFSFDAKQDMWQIKGNYEGYSPIRVSWSDGALIATASASRSRITSDPISVEAGKLYSATGYAKVTSIEEIERDGFLRIDFYERKDDLDISGISVGISQRVPATNEVEKVQVSGVAPRGAKFMTVSFQFKEAYSIAILDNVEVFETSEIPEEQLKEIPYINPTIPLESLYYNTFI
ncbi:MAG: hypothetical protein A2687_01745 [Candidatus Levybacteria bacterium RIFCSPHIGHO2_01_FULL_38_26]|nr:MAG: hypothetical protein A2687_01745 [Candidatus Levybacteria bacterium RIFCSPHIGHO2_01_FULL_38_26]